jgi:hypothetical protein
VTSTVASARGVVGWRTEEEEEEEEEEGDDDDFEEEGGALALGLDWVFHFSASVFVALGGFEAGVEEEEEGGSGLTGV